MIITIGGRIGSGKSTVSKILAQNLPAKRIYVGGIRRELAREMGMNIAQLNEYGKSHPETDVDVDNRAAAQARDLEQQGNVVIAEGLTMFHCLPESIKIFIKVDLDASARRIWNDLQDKAKSQERNEGDFKSFEETKQSIEVRAASDTARYQKYYGFDHLDESHYDFIVDSTDISAQEVADKVLGYIRKRQENTS